MVTTEIPPAGASDDQIIAALASALAAGAGVAVIAKILGRMKDIGAALARTLVTNQGWRAITSGLKAIAGKDSGAAVRRAAREQEVVSRAAYLVRATRRMKAAYATKDKATIAAATEREKVLKAAHLAAQTERTAAASEVARQVKGLKPDRKGEILRGWYAEEDGSPDVCRTADGRNFNALVRPAIGYPGGVHPNCKCTSGKPHAGGKRVEDIVVKTKLRWTPGVEIRVSALKFLGPKLWKYWTKGEGVGRYIGKPHPWTALRNALLKEGVPAHMVDGLATNIMMATPAGKAAYKQGHPGKKRSEDMTETRSIEITEVRGEKEGEKPGFTAMAVKYGVRDSYGTSWRKGVFRETLREGIPVLWSHDRADPIGRVTEYRDAEDGLYVEVDLDDLDSVPRAKQAYAQLKSGTMREFSFGFQRKDERRDPKLPNTTEILKADVHEISLVMRGAVPGTGTLAVRAATIPAERAAELLTKVESGELRADEALAELRGTAEDTGALFEIRAVDGAPADGLDPMAVLGDVDTALAQVSDSLDATDIEGARRYFSNAARKLSELQYLLGIDANGFGYYAAEAGEARAADAEDDEPDDLAGVADLLDRITG